MRALRNLALATTALLLVGAAPAPDVYGEADFARVRKLDAHVHANVADPAFVRLAATDGFELLSISTLR